MTEFNLFGDPAMELKIPLPYRPEGLQGHWRLNGDVELSWQAAADCNGNAVAGYRIYRSTRAGSGYVRLNATPIDATEFTSSLAPYDLVSQLRASFFITGPMLVRQGAARIPLPGGCAIGALAWGR